jgi:hypothetical protein
VKRRNPRASQFVRGFRLGLMYAAGTPLTSASIRRRLLVSRATAKRDMKAIAKVVKVTPSKVTSKQRMHFPRVAVTSGDNCEP